MGNIQLSGLVALVTGSGSGIGAGIAETLANYGAVVAVQDLKEDLAQNTVSKIKDLGGKAIAVTGDIANTDDIQVIVQTVVNELGKIDILVNSVGFAGELVEIEHMSDEDWIKSFQINLSAPFKMCRAVVPHMRKQKFGRIINVPTKASERVNGAYTAAKAGIAGLTRHLAAEEGENKITVNAILPGTTEMVDLLLREELPVGSLLGRNAIPNDHGEAAAYLASEAAEHITGIALPVDGGASVFGGPAMIAR